jgi:hypothetical protein
MIRTMFGLLPVDFAPPLSAATASIPRAIPPIAVIVFLKKSLLFITKSLMPLSKNYDTANTSCH